MIVAVIKWLTDDRQLGAVAFLIPNEALYLSSLLISSNSQLIQHHSSPDDESTTLGGQWIKTQQVGPFEQHGWR